MISIFNYAKYPTEEEYNQIYFLKKDLFEKIQLNVKKKSYNLLDCIFNGYGEIELDYWIREFNNRGFDLINNYIVLMHYYNMEIPDDEWYISPGRDGSSVEYFPNFKEQHYAFLYWFGFYMDSYYSRFFSLIDTIYHLINIKYDFKVNNDIKFKINVSNKLKIKDKELYNCLNSLRYNDIYKKIQEFRNNITHNYRPNQINSGINESNENGERVITFSVGNYTPTSKFIENIEGSIYLLSELIEQIKGKIED